MYQDLHDNVELPPIVHLHNGPPGNSPSQDDLYSDYISDESDDQRRNSPLFPPNTPPRGPFPAGIPPTPSPESTRVTPPLPVHNIALPFIPRDAVLQILIDLIQAGYRLTLATEFSHHGLRPAGITRLMESLQNAVLPEQANDKTRQDILFHTQILMDRCYNDLELFYGRKIETLLKLLSDVGPICPDPERTWNRALQIAEETGGPEFSFLPDVPFYVRNKIPASFWSRPLAPAPVPKTPVLRLLGVCYPTPQR